MISVLIPAYNEADRIGTTILSMQAMLQHEEHELLVIDDGSKDETTLIALKRGASVITLPVNQGKGKAMNHGIREAKGEIFLFVDADLGESALLLYPLLEPIRGGDADMTIAHFPRPKVKGGFGIVKGLAHHGLYVCTGNRFYSPISGQRALRRQVLDEIGGFKPGWGMEVALTIDAHHQGFQIQEVPLELSHRETGRNLAGFLHRGQQFRDIFITLSKAFWQYRIKKGDLRL